jgi:Winged helix DNA-binding domain
MCNFPSFHTWLVTSITWRQVLAWRIGRQHLAARAARAAALEVVGAIAGLHAQLAASAELTLWARVADLERGAVERALWEDRRLVKTWAMRGTLHLLPAEELPVWVAAQGMLKPRHHTGAWQRYYDLTREQAEAMLAAIPAALDGRQLTREELAAEVASLTGIAGLDRKLRSGFGELLKPAAFRGELCFAPSDGQAVRFARPDQWLGPQRVVDTDEAARVVARRYLAAYGPATREAFGRWFGSPSPAVAGRWLQALGDEVATVAVEGEPGLMLAADVDALAGAVPAGTVRLLPAFDQYVVAAPRDRDPVLAAADRSRMYRPQGWLSPVVLVDGRMAGVWKHERTGGRVTVEVTPFGRPAAAERRAVEAEAAALAAFLGGALELRWA